MRENMKIIKADISDAAVVGYVHSTAWKQTYVDIFAEEYLNEDTPEKRTQECLDAWNDENISYYIIYVAEKAAGIVKIIASCAECEITSLYILEEYRNRGYGRQAITYLKKAFAGKKMQLWVLENNIKARHFYEKNGFKNTGRTRSIYRGNDYVQVQYELTQEIWAYEMYFDKETDTDKEMQTFMDCVPLKIDCVPLKKEHYQEYMHLYNECFYDMRKALDIEPYNWYSQESQIEEKAENIVVLLKDNEIVGSVACYGNEIDDLIVKKTYRNIGYGKQLLLWAINHIRQKNDSEITLHVAEWNEGALRLYEKVGFSVRKREKIR